MTGKIVRECEDTGHVVPARTASIHGASRHHGTRLNPTPPLSPLLLLSMIDVRGGALAHSLTESKDFDSSKNNLAIQRIREPISTLQKTIKDQV